MSIPELNEAEKEARSMICMPLDDLKTMEALETRVDELAPVVGIYKVGMGSYTRFGPEAVNAVHRKGTECFLDLKYKDIPNTVKDASYAATEMGVWMFNVHATGGAKMMEAARQGIDAAISDYAGKGIELRRPKLIAVTLLTSIDEKTLNEELLVHGSPEAYVQHLANLTAEAQLDGIVCAAADLGYLKLPTGFMKATPAIKGPNTPPGEDQKRVATPYNAVEDGSDVLVIGRAIRGPPTVEERLQAGYDCIRNMVPALEARYMNK